MRGKMMFKFMRRVLVAFGWFSVGWLAHLAMAVAASKGGLRIKGTDEVPLESPVQPFYPNAGEMFP